MNKQRKEKNAVSTADIIGKAVSLNPSFKGGDEKKWLHWVYEFQKRKSLSVRTRTCVSQETSTTMLPVKCDFCRRIMRSFHTRISDPKYLINMDETAVYLNCGPKHTVHPKGSLLLQFPLADHYQCDLNLPCRFYG